MFGVSSVLVVFDFGLFLSPGLFCRGFGLLYCFPFPSHFPHISYFLMMWLH